MRAVLPEFYALLMQLEERGIPFDVKRFQVFA